MGCVNMPDIKAKHLKVGLDIVKNVPGADLLEAVPVGELGDVAKGVGDLAGGVGDLAGGVGDLAGG